MKKIRMSDINFRDKRGITLLIAVLTSALLLSISLSIFNLAIKEILISSSGRESHIAFYAADSGVECALYWDNRGAFATTTTTTITCAEEEFEVGGFDEEANMGISLFTINIPDSDACSSVSVKKVDEETLIETRGYNACIEGVSRKTERGIRVRY